MNDFTVGSKQPENIVLQARCKNNKSEFAGICEQPEYLIEDFSPEVAQALKSQILYKREGEDFKEYIPKDSTTQDIKDILSDKQEVGRSFSGYKNTISYGIEKSKNPKLAIGNLNVILNAKNKKLNASTVSGVLAVSEAVNNGGPSGKHYQNHYGFEGGKLDNKSIDKIIKTKEKDEMMLLMLQEEYAANNSIAS